MRPLGPTPALERVSLRGAKSSWQIAVCAAQGAPGKDGGLVAASLRAPLMRCAAEASRRARGRARFALNSLPSDRLAPVSLARRRRGESI
jgi:hypothetical protein